MCEMIHDGLMQTLKNSSTRHHLSMMSLGFHSCPLPPSSSIHHLLLSSTPQGVCLWALSLSAPGRARAGLCVRMLSRCVGTCPSPSFPLFPAFGKFFPLKPLTRGQDHKHLCREDGAEQHLVSICWCTRKQRDRIS